MGSMLSFFVCSTAQCAANVCISQMCSCCGSATGSAKSVLTRLGYSFQFILFALFAWIMGSLRTWIGDAWWFSYIPGLKDCPSEVCYGPMAVYRVAFALTVSDGCLVSFLLLPLRLSNTNRILNSLVFHGVMACIMLGVKSSKDARSFIQDGLWFFKFVFLAGVGVAAFFIPNEFFIGYGYVALAGASIFILIQLVLLVDFAHSWNERWVSAYDETQSRLWAALLLGSTVTMYLGSLVGTILMYVYLQNAACGLNTTFISLNLIFCIIFSLFSINPRLQEKNPRAGLLTSAVVTGYCTYLVFSAISSEPDEMGCKGPMQNGSGSGTSVFIGVAFTFLAVLWSTFSVSGSSQSLFGDSSSSSSTKSSSMSTRRTDPDDVGSAVPDESLTPEDAQSSERTKLIQSNDDVEGGAAPRGDDEEDTVTYSYSFFHLTFTMAAMYLAMLLTNWKTVSESPEGIAVDYGMVSVWVKMVSSWIVMLIYVWTLIAPVFFPDRVFS